MGKVSQANGIIDLVQKDEALLFCSFGKDSLVLLDLLYPKVKRLVVVFMYFVQGLEHVEKYIRWAQSKYPNIEVIQIPHWTLTHVLRAGLFCVPNPKIKLLKLSDIEYAMRLKTGIDTVYYGMKKADSLNRRLMLMGYNNGIGGHKVFPLTDWTNKDVLSYMKSRKLPSPVRYSNKASGGVGFNQECFSYLRDNYPQDLQKILKAFPLSEKILFDART